MRQANGNLLTKVLSNSVLFIIKDWRGRRRKNEESKKSEVMRLQKIEVEIWREGKEERAVRWVKKRGGERLERKEKSNKSRQRRYNGSPQETEWMIYGQQQEIGSLFLPSRPCLLWRQTSTSPARSSWRSRPKAEKSFKKIHSSEKYTD